MGSNPTATANSQRHRCRSAACAGVAEPPLGPDWSRGGHLGSSELLLLRDEFLELAKDVHGLQILCVGHLAHQVAGYASERGQEEVKLAQFWVELGQRLVDGVDVLGGCELLSRCSESPPTRSPLLGGSSF